MCINHVLCADDICLLAPTASDMQTLLDVCYEYGIDNDILFNPIKSVCTVFKPKAYKLYFPTVSIGSDALKFIRESKYLSFTFSDSKSDDCDMLRQMRLLYAKSNKLLRTSPRPEVRGTANVGWRSLFPLPINPPRTHSRLYYHTCLWTDGQWRT